MKKENNDYEITRWFVISAVVCIVCTMIASLELIERGTEAWGILETTTVVSAFVFCKELTFSEKSPLYWKRILKDVLENEEQRYIRDGL